MVEEFGRRIYIRVVYFLYFAMFLPYRIYHIITKGY